MSYLIVTAIAFGVGYFFTPIKRIAKKFSK